MRYLRSRIESSADILKAYSYPQPFHLHLKQHFKLHKKFGSKDRKAIAQLCYAYLRAKRLLKENHLKLDLLISAYILLELDATLAVQTAAELGYQIDLPYDVLGKKNRIGYIQEYIQNTDQPIYEEGHLSSAFKDLNSLELLNSKPYLWYKVAPGKEVNDTIHYRSDLIHTAFYSEEHIDLDENIYQIQDLSSQVLCSKIQIQSKAKVWDCCSGAGGKSLGVYRPDIDLYLSDTRENIMRNASNRFSRYGLNKAHFNVIDLLQNPSKLEFGDEILEQESFDVIIVDAPCSGSGTWLRTPEHISLFNYAKVQEYADRQRAILKNVKHFLKPEGTVYYLTCSVFALENENVAEHAVSELGYRLSGSTHFNGATHHADSMYMAALSLQSN